MDIEFRIKQLENFLLKESPKFPLSGSRLVNEALAQRLLAQLREDIPAALTQAQQLLAEREAWLAQAQQEAERIIAAAREEGRQLTEEHRVMQEAKQQAALLRQQVREEVQALRAEADEYVFNMLSQLQQELARLQRTVDNGLQKLETDRERRLQG